MTHTPLRVGHVTMGDESTTDVTLTVGDLTGRRYVTVAQDGDALLFTVDEARRLATTIISLLRETGS